MGLDRTRAAIAEQRAEELIARLGIHEPEDIAIEDIALSQGALVLLGGLEGAEGRLTRSANLSFIRIREGIREIGRQRFAIAHEVGHLLLHGGHSQVSFCTSTDFLPYNSNSPTELEANVFAATILMPKKMFEPGCKTAEPSLALVAKLAEAFDVTLTAAATRYIEFCPHRCCLVISRSGKIGYHRPTRDFGYFLQPKEELNPKSYAADFFRGERVRSGMRSVPASAWLEGSKIDDSKRISEDSLPMPSYDSVLTLLWIDRDIDQRVTGMNEEEDELEAEQQASDARWSWNRYRR